MSKAESNGNEEYSMLPKLQDWRLTISLMSYPEHMYVYTYEFTHRYIYIYIYIYRFGFMAYQLLQFI